MNYDLSIRSSLLLISMSQTFCDVTIAAYKILLICMKIHFKILDSHAPLKRRAVILRPSKTWYTERIAEAKRKRGLQHRWRESKLCIHRQLYVEQCQVVNRMLHETKVPYYSSLISENSPDQRELFSIMDRLLHRKS